MHTVLLRPSRRLWLLASTLLVLVQPRAWAEGNMRKDYAGTTLRQHYGLDRPPA